MFVRRLIHVSTALVMLASLTAVAVAGCSTGRIDEQEMKDALAELPYEVEYYAVEYEGPGSVIAGTARDGKREQYFVIEWDQVKYDRRALREAHGPVASASGQGFSYGFNMGRSSSGRLFGDILDAICVLNASEEECAGP